MHAGFLVNMPHVSPGRVVGDVELLGNPGGAPSLQEKGEHLFFPVGEAVLVELPLVVAAYGFSNPTLRGLVLPQDVEPHVRNEDDKQRAPDRVDNGVSKGYEARYGQGYGRDVRPQRACRNRKAGLPMTIARSMDMEKPQGKAVMRTLAPPERSALIHGTMSKSRLARIAQ